MQIVTTKNLFVIVAPSIGVGKNALMMVTMIMLKMCCYYGRNASARRTTTVPAAPAILTKERQLIDTGDQK